jgi:hypothetical protein
VKATAPRVPFTMVSAQALETMAGFASLPLLFMRSIITAIKAAPRLQPFIQELLGRLMYRQVGSRGMTACAIGLWMSSQQPWLQGIQTAKAGTCHAEGAVHLSMGPYSSQAYTSTPTTSLSAVQTVLKPRTWAVATSRTFPCINHHELHAGDA